ncbi:MAG: thiamine diphosphokinase [Ruminococcaceae bacterium]|nr:thiamine diphosphokinase [Oscillospiraceae bacterium]
MKTCYIVGAGEFEHGFTPRAEDIVIAADGGYSALVKKEIRCDLLIGDMDSISKIPSEIELIRHPVEKDETDTHLAFLEGWRRGYRKFEIYGGTGGRSDHTFANYCLLLNIKNHGGDARLYSDTEVAYIIKNSTMRVTGKPEKTISVFAFGAECSGVNINGLYYELSDGSLSPDFPLGVSNKFVSDVAEIGVKNGALLVIQEL